MTTIDQTATPEARSSDAQVLSLWQRSMRITIEHLRWLARYGHARSATERATGLQQVVLPIIASAPDRWDGDIVIALRILAAAHPTDALGPGIIAGLHGTVDHYRRATPADHQWLYASLDRIHAMENRSTR